METSFSHMMAIVLLKNTHPIVHETIDEEFQLIKPHSNHDLRNHKEILEIKDKDRLNLYIIRCRVRKFHRQFFLRLRFILNLYLFLLNNLLFVT